MAATQETASRAFGTAGAIAQPQAVWSRRKSRQALVAALCVALLGAFAYGVFAAIDGGSGADGGEAFIHRAEQDAAHLDAMAEAFESGALTSSRAPSARALEAYGERWAALDDSLAPNVIDAAALAAYGERWTALGERVAPRSSSQAALDAYGARWAALGDQYPVSS